jgi:hypothetical protein
MRHVYTAQNLTEAELLRTILDGRGIKTSLRNEYLQGALGELPMTLLPEVWIQDSGDYELARRWIEEYEQRKQEPPGVPWTCQHCREENPGNFELCWKCRRER